MNRPSSQPTPTVNALFKRYRRRVTESICYSVSLFLIMFYTGSLKALPMVEDVASISYVSVPLSVLTVSSISVGITPDGNKILYVNKHVNGGNGSGDSWANAIPELADALKWANTNKDNGIWSEADPLKIYVAKGTYKPMYTPEDGKDFSADAQYARDRTFLMVKDVELYGGFDPANGKTALADRILPDENGANLDGTILSGDLNEDDAVGTTPGQGAAPITGNAENAYHVVLAASDTESVAVKLDGFGITGGNANGSSGIIVKGQSVSRNSGGGIFSFSSSSSSSVTLSNSSVYNNSSSSSVYNDISSGAGGGIYSSSFSSSSSSVTLSNSSVYNNSSSGVGSGICSVSSSSSVTLSSSSLYNNSSSGAGGGGIFSFSSASSSVSLSSSSVYNNSSSGNGGGIYSHSYSPSSVSLSSSSVYNNSSSGNGSGIYSYSYSSFSNKVKLYNSTLAGNTGASYVYFDGNGDKKYIVYNSLVYGNAKSTTDNSNSTLSTNAGNISKDIQYSLVQGVDAGSSTVAGDVRNNNLDGTVAYTNLFMDAAAGDYRLSNNSPAIDAGSNVLYAGDLENDLDLAGNPRLSGCKIDIGAYENQSNQGTSCFSPDADNILYVNKHVNGGNGSGDSWANAIPELADALKWANANRDNGLWSETVPLKIYVAKGTYKPMYTPEDGKNFSADTQYARDRTFLMVKDVELYGGFDPANGKTALADRILPDKNGANLDGTILSGDLESNDAANIPVTALKDHATRQDNAYHVVLAAHDTDSVAVVLDGFGITGGNANGSLLSIIVNEKTTSGEGGGGIYVTSDSSCYVTLTNSSLYNNSASSNGGGIYSSSYDSSCFVTLTNSSLYNSASSNGGGIYCNSGLSSTSSVTLTNSSLYNNSASYSGGGIYCNSYFLSYSYVTLTNSSLYNNSASSDGGGIYSSSRSSCFTTLTNSSLYNNSASYSGGGICSSSPSPSSLIRVLNSSLIGNRGAETVNYSGGLEILNSIIYENKDKQGNPFITDDWLGGSGKSNDANRVYKNSLVQGDPDGQNGNLIGITDPKFVDAANGDYSLQVGSPLINVGDNSLYTGTGVNINTDKDLAGNPRLYDGTIDIGPYERQMKQQYATLADVNKVYGDADFVPDVTVPAGALTYASSDNTIAAYDAVTKKITIKKVGVVTITATQAGSTEYDPFSGAFELTVAAKPIAVVFKDDATISKAYDGTTDGVIMLEDLEFAAGAIVGNDEVNIELNTGKMSYDSKGGGRNKTVSLPLSGLALSGDDAANYTLAHTGAIVFSKASITPIPLTISADNDSKIYDKIGYTGGNGVVYTGFIPDESATDLDGTLSYAGDAQGATEVGEYTIIPEGLTSDNYDISYKPGKLTIKKAKQTISFTAPETLGRDAGTVALDVRTDAGLPVSLSVDDPSVATVSDTELYVHRLGTVKITATQAGDANHEAAEAVTVTVRVAADAGAKLPIVVHQALSPNGDGINEFLMIEGIQDFPENKITIFDKNGSVQAEIIGYNNRDRVFTGKESRDGTYYYYLDLKDNGVWKREKGYFVIRR